NPISADASGYYRQQYDPNTNQTLAYQVQPKLSTQHVMVNRNGKPQPLLITTNPSGDIEKVIDAVNGNPLMDKSLLQTIRTGFNKVQSVDENGDPVWRWEPVTTTSEKALPGGTAGAAPTGGSATSAGTSAGTAPASSRARGPAPVPAPLTAATRAASEFART